MKVKSCCLGLFVLVFGLGVVGCVSRLSPGFSYQKGKLYYGPKLPANKVASLQTFKGPLSIILDGQRWEFKSYSHVKAKIPAGIHEIEWYHKPSGANFTYHGKGTLDAKPGKYYLIYWRYLSGGLIERWEHRQYEYYKYTVKDYATWIEECPCFGLCDWGHLPRGPVVVGEVPEWANPSTAKPKDEQKQ